MLPERVKALIALANHEAASIPDFFAIKGPGLGDRATAGFIASLRRKAESSLGPGIAEVEILRNSKVRVDYWFKPERTFVEIALSLRNPLSEFERDVLKAVVAQPKRGAVKRLVLVGKPGATKRVASPWYQTVIKWVKTQGIEVHVEELTPKSGA